MGSFKRDIDELVLVPSGGGRFEIQVDGEPIYSKLDTGQFPDEEAVEADVRSFLR